MTSCTFSHVDLTPVELGLHHQVLRVLGHKRQTWEDEDGEMHHVKPFIERLKPFLRNRGRFDFSRHVIMCGQVGHSPHPDHFDDALHRARNFALARVLILCKACLDNKTYRPRILGKLWCNDGTVYIWHQIADYFADEYYKIESRVQAIRHQFANETLEDRAEAYEKMADLLHTRENRQPAMAPYTNAPIVWASQEE